VLLPSFSEEDEKTPSRRGDVVVGRLVSRLLEPASVGEPGGEDIVTDEKKAYKRNDVVNA
jgi:hypothetical protein